MHGGGPFHVKCAELYNRQIGSGWPVRRQEDTEADALTAWQEYHE